MPYLSDDIKIANTQYDRRIKISEQDKEDIKIMYKNGVSIRGIARHFVIDKRNIHFILFPERLIRNKQCRVERGGSKEYYDKNKWKQVMKEHRHYKHELYKNGKIKIISKEKNNDKKNNY